MSLSLYVFIPAGPLPSCDAWQAAIDRLGFPVVIDPGLDLPRSSGFRPCVLDGQASGFELYCDSGADLVAEYPQLRGRVDRAASTALIFQWGGDLRECACVLAAAAALVDSWRGLAYYPDDDLIYDAATLARDFRECLVE
jgi:hypothetical protein